MTSFKGFVATILSIELFPFALIAIEEFGKTLLCTQSNLPKNLLLCGMNVGKASCYSLMHTIPICAVGILALAGIKHVFQRLEIEKVDPAGHAISAYWHAAIRFYALTVLHRCGLRAYSYIAFTSLMSFAEGIWVYDTAVNHHSVVDMIAGSAMGLASMKAYSLVFPIVAQSFRMTGTIISKRI